MRVHLRALAQKIERRVGRRTIGFRLTGRRLAGQRRTGLPNLGLARVGLVLVGLVLVGLSLAGASPAVAPWLIRPAAAEDMLRIAAIVNDEVISAYDLEQRLKLALSSTGLPDTAQNRERLHDQVLRALIDERLEMQEAKRLNVTVDDADISHAFKILAQQNKIPEGHFEDFLRQQHVDVNALISQIKAEIAWSRVVRQKFLPQIEVSDEEVNAALARIEANRNAMAAKLSLIFLAYDSPDQAEKVRRQAQQLVEQIRGGANFAGTARQFSQGPAASAGGDIGWVQPGTLPEDVDKVIATLPLNVASDPIRSLTGFYIVEVHDRRTVASVMAQSPTPAAPVAAPTPAAATTSVKIAPNASVHLMQALFQLPSKPTAKQEQAAMAQARRVIQKAKNCRDMGKVTAALQSASSGDIGTLKIVNLPKVLQEVVATLPIGKPSEPIRSANGVHVLMVCERTGVTETKAEPPAPPPPPPPPPEPVAAKAGAATEVPLPSKEQVHQRLVEQKVELKARGFLRDLRRDAIVEFR